MRQLAVVLALALVAPAAAQPAPKQQEAKSPPAPHDPVFQKSGIADWWKAPAPTKEPTFKPPAVKRMKLANGIVLLVAPNHALPIISMTLVVPGAGAAQDPAGKSGLAAFTADLLDEGVPGLSALGIAEELDRLGASIGAGVDVDSAQVSVSSLTKTLEQTLDLFTKVVTQPAFQDKEVERVKGDRVTSLDQRRDRPREVASIMLNAALFGAGTPYGHPGSGIREEFKTLGLADAKAFYTEHWNPAVMTLVVAGDVDLKALKKQLDAGLGTWKPAGAKRPAKLAIKPAKLGARLLLADRPAAAQSDVRIGLIGPSRKDRRYFQFEVFRTILGDGFTSRLVNRLREQLGITYGIFAAQDWRAAAPGPFLIGSAIVTAETGKGMTEIMKIVGDLATVPVPTEEFEKAKQNIIRALPARFETNSAVVDSYVDLVVHGLPDDWWTRYAAGVRNVRVGDVKAVAKAFVPANKLVFAIVGDLAKIRGDLDKLGLGAPAMYDLYGSAK